MNTKLLSVCMITKNDEKYIKSCLHGLEELSDEIIIVDIASTDRTVDIAKRAGASVYRMKWRDSFAKAKNFCMGHANGRWILFLQANESIAAEDQKKLKALLDNPNAEGYLLHTDYQSAGRSISSPIQFLRLIRNRKQYRFEYRSFETIPDKIIDGIQNTSIKIRHHYDPECSWEIPLRTSLLNKDIMEHPDSCYLQYSYGIQLLNEGKYEDSIPYFQQACVEVNDDYLFAPHLYKMLGWVLLYLKRYEKALEVLDEGIEAFPYYTDLLVLRGELYKQQKRYQDSVRELNDCLNIISQSIMMVPGPEITISDIWKIMAESQEKLLNYRQALSYYQHAYELNHTDYSLLYKIAKLTPKENQDVVMDDLLKTSVTQKNAEQLVVLLDILYQHRAYRKILEYVDFLDLFPEKKEHAEIMKLSSHVMLEDRDDFPEVCKTPHVYGELLLRRIENHWLHDRWTQAERLLKEMDGLERIEPPIKALYLLIDDLLNGKKYEQKFLTKPEYEIVHQLHNLFVWTGQEDKAKKLLPLLLDERWDENIIQLAKPWAELDQEPVVERIYQHVSDENRIEFKQEIIEQFLVNGYTKTAQKFAAYQDSQPLGAIHYVLRSEEFMEKTVEWIHQQRSNAIPANSKFMSEKPSNSLITFYHCLCDREGGSDKIVPINRKAELSYAGIYEEIGKIYEKAKENEEAWLSYLHSLRCDPLNQGAREKVTASFYEDSKRFGQLLDDMIWNPAIGFFHNKQAFKNMVYGLVHFQKKNFSEALPFFLRITEDETGYPAALAYKFGCIWLRDFGTDLSQFDNQMIPEETLQYFFKICKEFVLNQLDEALGQYPASEMIEREKKRVSVTSLMI